MTIRVMQGDSLAMLRTLPSESVHLVVTSPPYFGLRSYLDADHPDKHLELGSETTPDEYIARLVEVFREARRLLRDDGICWINIGDSFCSTAPGTMGDKLRQSGILSAVRDETAKARRKYRPATPPECKPKDLLGIPFLIAFALRADGWYWRSCMPWLKKSCMPESCRDRPTSAVEYVMLFSKEPRYFWDAEGVKRASSASPESVARYAYGRYEGPRASKRHARTGKPDFLTKTGNDYGESGGTRNFRNSDLFFDSLTAPHGLICDADGEPIALDVNPHGFKDAHFATFPPRLVEPLIRAGTSEKGCCAGCGAPWARVVERGDPDMAHRLACGSDSSGSYRGKPTKNYDAALAQNASATKARILDGMVEKRTTGWRQTCSCPPAEPVPCTVLDPFAGAFTSCLVADRMQRDAIGIELSEEYCAMARNRVTRDAPLLAEVV